MAAAAGEWADWGFSTGAWADTLWECEQLFSDAAKQPVREASRFWQLCKCDDTATVWQYAIWKCSIYGTGASGAVLGWFVEYTVECLADGE